MKSLLALPVLAGALVLGALGGVGMGMGAGTGDASIGSVAAPAPEEGTRSVRQAARMVRYVVLESGLGVRWEPSEALIRRLEGALGRPWRELKPLSAPFARSDTPSVTTEALAWTILAEIAQARHRSAQGDPASLVYLYLASQQVGFAQEELLDRSTGLYRPAWRDGAPYGDPELDDQFGMLWALSAYSAAGALLPSDVARSEELFREQTAPLADRLFRALERLLRGTPRALDAVPLTRRALWAAALGAYERAMPSRATEVERLRRALLPEDSAIPEVLRWTKRPFGGRLALAELAERVLLLGAISELDDSAPQGARGEALRSLLALLAEPAVQRLLDPIPWPAEVVFNPNTQEWEAQAQEPVPVGAAMALAYGLLSLAPPDSPGAGPAGESPPRAAPSGSRRTLEELARKLRGMNERLQVLEAGLEALEETVSSRPPTDAEISDAVAAAEGEKEKKKEKEQEQEQERGEEGTWGPWDALFVGGALLLGLGGVLRAWRRQR